MFRKIAITWSEFDQKLEQAISTGMEFSFISKDNKQCIPFVFCRDFLQDAVHGYINKRKVEIYEFKYDYENHPSICLERAKIAIANQSDDYLDFKIPNILDFIHQIEQNIGLSKTIIKKCINPPQKYIRSGVWILNGSPRWMKSPPMLSLYTLMIRIGAGHKSGDLYEKTLDDIMTGKNKPYLELDKYRLKLAMPGVKKIFKNGDKKFFHPKINLNYPNKIKIPCMHNNLGIIGFSEGKSKKYIPYWHKERL